MSIFQANGYQIILELLIGNEKITKEDLSKIYAIAIVHTNIDDINWTKINTEIKIRWSPQGLKDVKAAAWQIIEKEKDEIIQSMSETRSYVIFKPPQK